MAFASEEAGNELVAVGEDWAAAIVSNDPARIAAFMADDWVIVSEFGVSARQEFLTLIESGQLSHSAMQRISDARVRVYGETAVVTSRVTNTAHYEDQRIDADEWTTDVYVRRAGRWLCALTHISTAAASPNSKS